MLPLLRRITSPSIDVRPDMARKSTSRVTRIATMPDIVAEIIRFVADPQDLAACMLVCRQWHPAARHRLYSNIRVSSKTGFERSHELLSDESERSRLARLIQGFTVTRATSILLPDLATLAPSLKRLTLASTAGVASSTFTGVLPVLTSLTSLHLINQDFRAPAVPFSTLSGTNAALAALGSAREASQAPGLTSLSIVNSPDLTDEGLAKYLSTSSAGASLLSLELSGCPFIGESILDAIADHCPDLRSLTLKAHATLPCPVLGTEDARLALAQLAERCPRLSSLSLSKFPLTVQATSSPVTLEPLASLTELRHVELVSLPWLTTDDLSHFRHATHLRLGHLPKLDNLSCLPEARSVAWTGSAVGSFALGNLYRFCRDAPHLRKLILDWTDHWSPPSSLSSRAAADWDRRMSKGTTDVDKALPAAFADYEGGSIFDSRLPSELVARALCEARDLERIALFGFPEGRRLNWRDVRAIERACPHLIRAD